MSVWARCGNVYAFITAAIELAHRSSGYCHVKYRLGISISKCSLYRVLRQLIIQQRKTYEFKFNKSGVLGCSCINTDYSLSNKTACQIVTEEIHTYSSSKVVTSINTTSGDVTTWKSSLNAKHTDCVLFSIS